MNTVPSSGKGDKCVYLVYGDKYELLGVAPTQETGYRLGTEYATPFRVLGPVKLGDFIDWEHVNEEAYGENFGPVGEYVNLNDGLPYEGPVEPLTKAQVRAIPSHARGH